MSNAYARSGVDTNEADAGVDAIVSVLKSINTGSPSRVIDLPGHFAAVLRITNDLGLAFCTDGVGSKVVVAEQANRLDTVGIDCVAMNVNDLVCVGAQPIALVDYLAVEQSDPVRLAAIAQGLKAGAEQAGIEIPGGELAQVPELINGHPSPGGFDLCASAIGTVALSDVVDGSAISPGDALIGLPSSGLHSNGLTLARKVLLENHGLDDRPEALGGDSIADVLLEPTVIYVRAALELLRSEIAVSGLFHLTGGGLTNLLRLGTGVGYRINSPLAPQPVFKLIGELANLPTAELYEVFNMGCGFAVTVPSDQADEATALLAAHHPGTAVIGEVTGEVGTVTVPSLSITGTKDGLLGA